jgi:alanyl aminopeptidase
MTGSIFAVLLAACNAALAAASDAPTFRLGDAAAPTSYEWHVAVDPEADRFEGDVRIAVHVARATPVLWLNAEHLEIAEARITSGSETRIAHVVRGAVGDIVGLEAEAGFEPGDYTVEMRYRGEMDAVATRGIFHQRDAGRWYALSQFEAISARRALPCFDEPGWKTPWRLTLDAPSTQKVASNTREASADAIAERPGWTRHVFERTKPLPTYLVALAVGPFDVADAGHAGRGSTPLRILAPQSRGSEARFARETTPALLRILEDYFGRSFPFSKLDQVPIPASVGFGAMENAGMITYSSELLLAQPRQESLAWRRTYAAAAAHEMAHQWFGDLVTLDWWTDVWLNEAFATWASRKAIGAWRPDFEAPWRPGESRARALRADRLGSARRIVNAVVERNDVYGAFDAITYDKGSQVISMFESWMGPERFRQGVRRYLDRHAYGSAISADFFEAIASSSQDPELTVKAFRSFVDQPGAPLIDVHVRCERNQATLELAPRRFVPRGQQRDDEQWITPACFRYADGGELRKECTEVRGRQSMPLHSRACPEWIAGNADGAGHWIARYDRADLEKLVANASALPEREAVALGTDASLLLETGLEGAHDALRTAQALLRHPAAGARRAGLEVLIRLREGQLSADDERLLAHIRSADVRRLAARIGWKPQPGDAVALQDLRAALLPYAADDADSLVARNDARLLAHAWLKRRDAIDASVVTPVLQTAGRFADAAFLGELQAALARESNRADRKAMINALALVRDPRLRDRVLDAALRREGEPGALDARESLLLLAEALSDKRGREPAFAFVRQHWDALIARLPPESSVRLVRPLGDLCASGSRERFAAFFAPKVDAMRGGPLAYRQALEAIDICVASRVR